MEIGISDHFRLIVRRTRICLDICGIDIFTDSYRINWRTCLVFVIINISLIFLAYTTYETYAVKGDWTAFLQMLSIGGGTLLQGYFKFMSTIVHQVKMRFLMNELHAIFDEYESHHDEYRNYLNRGLTLLSNTMKICAFINVVLVIGLAVITLVYSIITDNQILVVYGELPNFDTFGSQKNYMLTVILQVLFIGIGGFGFYAADMDVLTPISQIITMKDIMKCKFHDLNAILSEEQENRQKSLEALKDIIRFHQRYLKFVDVSMKTFFWVLFVQIVTYSVGIISTLFCLFLGTWPGGYAYLIYCFVMMYVYCGFGTLIDISNDGLINACYNDVRWYELSIDEAKMLRIMLMMAQNTSGLSVGGVMPLSMNTGLQITKTIYSIAMMLLNFVE